MNKTTFKKNFSNTTTIFPTTHDEQHPYTVISNQIIDDKRLDFVCVAIMLNILKWANFISNTGKPYIINKTYIQKQSGLGVKPFNKKWDKLVECGYIAVTKTFGSYNYEVYERPHSKSIKKASQNLNPVDLNHKVPSNICYNNICYSEPLESKDIKKVKIEESLESLEVKDQISHIRTDSIISADAEMSLSVSGNIPLYNSIDCNIDNVKSNPLFQYNLCSIDNLDDTLFNMQDFTVED